MIQRLSMQIYENSQCITEFPEQGSHTLNKGPNWKNADIRNLEKYFKNICIFFLLRNIRTSYFLVHFTLSIHISVYHSVLHIS